MCCRILHICFRYKRAHEALYGSNLDIATRFDVKEDERGILLLNKIWDVYQDAWGGANVGLLYGHKHYHMNHMNIHFLFNGQPNPHPTSIDLRLNLYHFWTFGFLHTYGSYWQGKDRRTSGLTPPGLISNSLGTDMCIHHVTMD